LYLTPQIAHRLSLGYLIDFGSSHRRIIDRARDTCKPRRQPHPQVSGPPSAGTACAAGSASSRDRRDSITPYLAKQSGTEPGPGWPHQRHVTIPLFKSRRYGGPGRHCRVCRLSGGTPSGHRFRSPRLPGTENFLAGRLKRVCAHSVLQSLAAVEETFCTAFECSLRNFELAGHPNSARRLSE
jgi:hypothetical protein